MSDTYAALRHPPFAWFLSSRVALIVGNQLSTTAVGWEIWQRARDPMLLGLVGLVQIVPFFVLALWTGRLADRADRRRILLFTQGLHTASALAFLGLSASGHVGLAPLYAVLALSAVARAVQAPAAQAIQPSLVPPGVFPNAVSWRAITLEVSTIAGPALGGLLIASRWGPTLAYAANAALALAGLIATARIPSSRPAVAAGAKGGLLDGIRFVKGNQPLLGAMTLDLFAVLFGGATALLPAFASDVLHVGPQGYGLLRAAPSIGSVLMFAVILHTPPIRQAGRILFVSVAAYGAAMIGFGLSTSFLLSMILLVASGMADAVSVLIRHTLVQTLTPDAMRGRVSAVNAVFFNASNELGQLESGLAARWLGVAPSVMWGGLATLGVVAACAWRFPKLRRLGGLSAGA